MKKILIFSFIFVGLLALADKFSDLELFSRAFFTIKNYSYTPVKRQSLIHSAIKGMLRDTDDHSQFLEPKDVKRPRRRSQWSFFWNWNSCQKRKRWFHQSFISY